MNWLLIITLAIIVICAFIGLKRGLITTLFSTCSLLAAIVLSVIFSPVLSGYLQSNDKVMGYFTEKVADVLQLEELVQQTTDNETLLEGVNLPDNVKQQISEKLNIQDSLNSAAADATATISTYVANMIIYALSYVVVFIVAWLAIFIVGKLLNLLAKLPGLMQVNKLAGFAVGAAQGILIIWILCIIITIMSGTQAGQTAYAYINDSSLLSFIYNNNLLMNFLISKVSGIM